MNQNATNYNASPSPAKGVGSLVSGVMLCIFGGTLLALGLVLVTVAAFGVGNIGFKVVLLAVSLCGGGMLYQGARRCRLYSTGRKVRAALQGRARERLTLLGEVTRSDNTRLVRDLRELAARGFFPGAYVDLNRREFVVQPGGPQPPIVHGNTQLREKRQRSVAPIYLLGAAWLVYALLFPLYRWYDFAIAAALSIGVFIVAGRVFPERVLIVEVPRKVEPPKPPEKINTGDEELDEVLTQAMQYMNELTALDVAITNERIDKPVQDLVYICKQIFDYIKKTPGKVRQIRQFMNYYLPTTIKLLQNYDELSREPVKGQNIRETMTKIEDTMQVILKAFQKELDDLYKDKAMDISVDIEVLQNMMEQEGLTGAAWQPGKPE